MKDFLGNEIKVGDYVAAGGAGNTKAEYGMILYRVEAAGEKLKLVRLTAHYPTFKDTETEIKASKASASNLNKYVVVAVPDHVRDLFDRGVAGTLTQAEKNLLGRWIHGAEHQRVWG